MTKCSSVLVLIAWVFSMTTSSTSATFNIVNKEMDKRLFVFVDSNKCFDDDKENVVSVEDTLASLASASAMSVYSVCPNASLVLDLVLHVIHDQRLLNKLDSEDWPKIVLANSVDVEDELHHVLPSLAVTTVSIKSDLRPLHNTLLVARELGLLDVGLVVVSRGGQIDLDDINLIVEEHDLCVEEIWQIRKSLRSDYLPEMKTKTTIVVDLTSANECDMDANIEMMANFMMKAAESDTWLVYQGIKNVTQYNTLLQKKVDSVAFERVLVLTRPPEVVCGHELVAPVSALINDEVVSEINVWEPLTLSLINPLFVVTDLGLLVNHTLKLNDTTFPLVMDVGWTCGSRTTSTTWTRYNDLAKTVLLTLTAVHLVIGCLLLLSEVCCCLCLRPDWSLVLLVLLVLLLDVGALLAHVDQHLEIMEMDPELTFIIVPSLMANLLTFLLVLTLVNLLTCSTSFSTCLMLWPLLTGLYVEILYNMINVEYMSNSKCWSTTPTWQKWPWMHCWLLLLFQVVLTPIAAFYNLKLNLVLNAVATWVVGLVVVGVVGLTHTGYLDEIIAGLEEEVAALALVVVVSFVVLHMIVLPQLCCGSTASVPSITPLSPGSPRSVEGGSEWSQQENREDTPDTMQMAEIDHNKRRANNFHNNEHFQHQVQYTNDF